MRLTSAILATLILITGCATMGLTPAATQAEKRAAMCTDAQTAYLMSVAFLDQIAVGQAADYWKAYKSGAMIGIQAYCPAQTTQIVVSK
jgi:heme/copper-type cytochrome/quinol oxidase subunit 3